MWSKRFGDIFNQSAKAVAVDDSGNVVILSQPEGAVDFGGGPLETGSVFSLFLAKFDAAGTHFWSKAFSSSLGLGGTAVAIDASGDVVITGSVDGDSVDFGGGPLVGQLSGDMFVAKFDGTGAHLWSKRFGEQGFAGVAMAAAIDGADDIVIAGRFDGSVDFGGGPLVSAGEDDVFVAKLDAAGNHLWSNGFGDAGRQSGVAAAVGASGNIVLVGQSEGTVDFGGGPLVSAGLTDVFVAKLDGAGSHLWSKCFGDGAEQYGFAVAIDGASNIIMAGALFGSADFGGGLLTSAGFVDAFVAKLDAAGNHLWSKRFGDGGTQSGTAVAVDGDDNVVVAGACDGAVDFGGGQMVSAGGLDLFLARFDSAGEHLWSRRFGDSEPEFLGGIAMDGVGHLVISGGFEGHLDFGGEVLESAGAEDIFLAELSP